MCLLHLVISPPPPSRSAMSRPSNACVLTPPLVVMVTSLLPTSQVILRPPAKRNSAMGDLRRQILSIPEKTSPQPPNALIKGNKTPCQPFRQGREVGKDISRHHVQTGLSELQVDSFQPLVRLSHRIFIGRAQTAGGGRGVHPTGWNREVFKHLWGQQSRNREAHRIQRDFNS